MMSEADTKAETAPSDAPDRAAAADSVEAAPPTGDATAADGSAIAGPESAGSDPQGAAVAPPATRKRVFTFQKRWLHTLPIMEKALPDSALDAASVVALRAANLLGDDGKPTDDAGAREVIVCMLCDDPNSSRETLKLWSRVNCRRGRIENHLMSKHPEFMLLLKQKRESEGDLAVQIFLQNMREGRCNVRNEISAGLYSHMQPISGVDVHGNGAKRSFGHDEFMMPNTTVPTTSPTIAGGSAVPVTGVFSTKLPHGPSYVGKDPTIDVEADARRKRLKTDGAIDLSNPAVLQDALSASLLVYQGPAAFSQWRNLLANKMVVILGGENPSIARTATNLWQIGANVLVTFADFGSMEAFAASYLAQFHTAEGIEPPRGVMLPLFCTLQSRSQIEEWSRSIATKFDQVDCLINLVSSADNASHSPAESSSVSGDGQTLSGSSSRSTEICQIFSSTCMQRSGRNSIINIAVQDANEPNTVEGAKLEVLTRSLAKDLRPINVQTNCIVLEQGGPIPAGSAEEDLELLHSILFFLSPTSASVSGSSIYLRRPNPSVDSTSNDVAVEVEGAVTSAATAQSGITASAAESNGSASELGSQVI